MIFSYEAVITRKTFEKLNKDLFVRIKNVLNNFYADNHEICSEINFVVAVGGSSRINHKE